MPKLPRLKVKRYPGSPDGEVCDFEQAKDLPFLDVLVFVEGQRVSSYEEFIQLTAQEPYKDREFLEVMVLSAGLIEGG